MRLATIVFPLALCLFHALPAYSQAIPVRSGEHSDFTRLVLSFPEKIEWEFGKNNEDYIFRPVDFNLESYLLQGIFERIPRERLKAITQDNMELRLEVSASTHASVFEFNANMIVIDIKEGDADPASKFERNLDNPKPSITATQNKTQLDPIFPIIISNQNNGSAQSSQPKENLENLPNDPQPIDTAIIENAEKIIPELQKNISRAIAQGLLETKVLQTVIEDEEPRSITTNKSNQSETSLKQLQDTKKNVTPQINIQTVVDRDREIASGIFSKTGLPVACITDSELDLKNWGHPIHEGIKIGELRQNIIGEFDRKSVRDIEKLAKYYLFLTFGTEAMATMAAYNLTPEEYPIIYGLAETMKKQQSTQYGNIHLQAHCEGQVALWALASLPEFSQDNQYNHKQALATFSALPLHLRRHIGPSIAQKYIDINDQTQAELYLDLIDRAPGHHGDAFDFVQAKVEMKPENPESASHKLTPIIETNSSFAAEAFIQLIDASQKHNHPVSTEIIDNAEAMLVEHRNSPLEAELLRAIIIGRTLVGDYSIGFSHLSTQRPGLNLSDEDQADLWSTLLRALTQNSSDLEFAQYTLSNLDTILASPADATIFTDLASRLLENGFTDAALRILQSRSNNDETSKLSLAKIELKKGNLDSALRFVQQVQSPQARTIEARVLYEQGRPNDASKLLRDNNLSTNDLQSYAFIAEDWEAFDTNQENAYAQFVKVMNENANAPPPPSDLSLETIDQVLQKSEKSRLTLNNLIKSSLDQ